MAGQRKRGANRSRLAASGVQALAAEFRPCPVGLAVEVRDGAAGATLGADVGAAVIANFTFSEGYVAVTT